MAEKLDITEDIRAIRKAWNDPGPRPVLHNMTKEKLEQQWPTLYHAIRKLVEKLDYNSTFIN